MQQTNPTPVDPKQLEETKRKARILAERSKTTQTIKTIGELLKELRTNRNLTTNLVSQQTGLPVLAIDSLEKPTREAIATNPLIVLIPLLSFYRIELADFFKEVSLRVELRCFPGLKADAKRNSYVF